MRPLSADSYGWSLKTGSDSCPSISPCFPGLSPTRTPSEQSSGHSLGTIFIYIYIYFIYTKMFNKARPDHMQIFQHTLT